MSNIQLLGMWSCGQIMVGSAQHAHACATRPRVRKLSINGRVLVQVDSNYILGFVRYPDKCDNCTPITTLSQLSPCLFE